MTDRELLELAAKAAGIADYKVCELAGGDPALYCRDHSLGIWAPLVDDGDALRLAVKLGMVIEVRPSGTSIRDYQTQRQVEFVSNTDEADSYAATRRAIVRAAAAVGSTK